TIVGVVLIEIDGVNHTMTNVGGFTYEYNWTKTSVGIIYYTIYANDTENDWNSFTSSFVIVDTTPPAFSDLAKSEDPLEFGNTLIISVNSTDLSDINQIKIEFEDSNHSMTNIGGNAWQYDLWIPSASGNCSYTIWAEDNNNNWAFINDSILVQDTTPPSPPILVSYPQGEVSDSLIFDWQDGSDPSGIAKYRLIIDNETDPFSTPGFVFEINITSSYYEYTGTLQLGTYHFFLYQIDGTGHQSLSSTGSFSIISSPQPSQPPEFPFWIIIVILGVVIGGLIGIMVLKKKNEEPVELKRKMEKSVKPKRKKELKIRRPKEFKDQNVYLKRGIDFLGGLVRYKVVITNKSKMIISNIDTSLQMTAEHVRLIDIKPKVYKKLNRALIPNMSPGQSVSIDFYLEPMICGRIPITPLITYLDAYNKPRISSGNPLDVISKCPLIINPNEENIAKVKKIYEDNDMIKAKRTFELEYKPRKSFDLLQEAVGKWAGKQVSKTIYESTEPFIAEVYYYNLNQNVDPDLGSQEQIIIKIRVDESTNVASLSVGSEKNETVNGILTHIWQLANEKYGNIFGKNFESLHCPFCGTSVECLELDQELIMCSNCGEKCIKNELKKF
ncbi:MAG: hypothetical protein ACTSPS_15390, partial [Promethearchaeota archaeon]